MSTVLAPVTLPSNGAIQLGGPDSISAIRVTNESGYSLSVTMDGNGGSYPVDAYTADIIFTKQYPGWNGAIEISAQTILTNTGGTPDMVLLTIFGKMEAVNGTYPVGLTRYIGNEVTTVGGIATTLVNASSPAGTLIISTREPGDTSDNFAVYNNGNVLIGAGGHSSTVELSYGSNLTFLPSPGTGGGTTAQMSLDLNGVLHIQAVSNLRQVSIDGSASGVVVLDAGNGAIDIQSGGVSINGSTSGTLTVFQDCTGTVKRLYGVFNNFKNGSTPAQNLTLITPFLTRACIQTSSGQNMQFLSNSVAQSANIITTLASTGGTQTTVTTVGVFSIGEIAGPFDTISIPGSNASSHTGTFTITGI